MRRLTLAALLCAILVLSLATASAASRSWVQVAYFQDGTQVSAITSGITYEIRGTGFRSTSPAWVCPIGGFCVKSDVASDGSFTQTRNDFLPTGTYMLKVDQKRNSGRLDTVYTGTITYR